MNKLAHYKFLTITMFLMSGTCFSHEGEQSDTHAFEDAYLAEQARLKESELPYMVDHWQQQFAKQLNDISAGLLPDLVKTAAAAGGNPAVEGQWGTVTTWPFAFASASNLPDGRILAWGGNNKLTFTGGNYTYASIWDPATNMLKDVNHPTHSLFCGVPVMTEDGSVFVPGGDKSSASSVKATSIFNTATQSWTRIKDMAVGRWYNGTVYMPNGKVFTALGDPGSPYPEIWSPGPAGGSYYTSGNWSYLNGISFQAGVLSFPTVTEPKNWLPHLHLAPNGQILHSGHTPKMHTIDTDGNGSMIEVGISNDVNISNTPSVLIDEGKILQVGGALFQANNPATPKAALLDFNGILPSRTVLPDMQYARIFHNLVTLPNGEVLVIGGNTTGTKFSDVNSQLTPEIWSPVTQSWRPVAPHAIPRNYHSVALLMADGRVWSGGGGLCGCAADHLNSQVYSPPYLFNADGSPAIRPQILNAPSVISYGQDINVTTTPGITKFSMVRMSSTTHALNSDMRYLNVPFTTVTDGTYKLSFHTNPNVMVPGYWMLFALNEQGVPSIAKIVRVSTTNSPIIDNINDQASILNNTLAFNVQASDPNGDTLTYKAIGLPTGLTINSATGVISGKPKALGNFMTVVSVTDGTNEVSVKFFWNIVSPSTPFASPVYGSPGGTAFADVVSADKKLISLKISGGWYIDSIQGTLNTGDLPKHGGNGGTVKTVSWPASEYLVRVYGVVGTYVGKVSFVTNTGRVLGPYGTATNIGTTTTFDYTVPADNEIVGFTGRAGTYLNALGVMYRERQILNQPPAVASIGDQANNVGEAVSLQVNANDPEGTALTYSATGLPAGLSLSPTTGLISGKLTTQGNYNVIVTVTDADGAVAALNFTWSVKLSALIINQPETSPQLVNTSVALTASVANGTNPKYKWSFGDGSAETAYSSSPTVNHTYTVPNLYVVRLTVTDDSGAISTKTFIQAIHLPQTVQRPNVSTNIAISKAGGQLWVVNQDNDTVSVFDTSTSATKPVETKLAETQVGLAPRALAQAPDGTFWVTNKKSATISVLDSTIFQVQKTINLPYGSQPFGIVFAPNNSAAYVVLEGSGKLLKLDPGTGAQIASLDLGSNPRHLSITADSSKVLVSRFITKPLAGESTAVVQTPLTSGGEVLVVNTASMSVSNTVVLRHSDIQDNTIAGSGIPNYLHSPVISPDGLTVRVPSKQDNVKRGTLRNGNNIDFQNTVRGISSKLSLTTLSELYSDRIDYDNTGVISASIYDKSGSYLFVALESTREVAIVDAYGDIVVGRFNVGRAPDGLALSADGNKLYVNNFMDRTVSVVDLTNVFTRGDWAPPVISQLSSVAVEKLSATVLKGKQLFYDAKDLRLARDGYLSCAVCHNDGGHDGRVWDLTGLGEGLRNTIDLRGRSGTSHGLLHWSANFDEIQDFEGQIRSLAGGTGLMSDTDFSATSSTLGAPKAGLSSDLDALAAYVGSLGTFAPSPYRNNDGSLTLDAAAGKVIFGNARCTQCHGGAPFTDSPSKVSHDIGTIKATSGQRLNAALTGLDTPTLRDVWNTAPYLHDGSAPTVEAAISAHTGVPEVAALTSADIAKVAAYVRQIGGDEVAPGNLPPNVGISSPAPSTSFLNTAAISLTARAADTDGSIAKVEFYAGNTLLGIGTLTAVQSQYNEYTFVWRGAGAGTYSITAKAYDNIGAVTASAPVSITVSQDLLTTGGGLKGQYFNNTTLSGTPVLQRQEAVNFNWAGGAPGAGVRTDYFSVRWSGQIFVPATGDYQFQTVTDDGLRLTVNGALVINDWTNHAATTRTTSTIRLIGGQKYNITMDYYDNTGSASARLLWKAPGQTAFAIIPADRLF